MRNFTAKVNDTAPLATGVLDAAEDNVRFEELETAVTVSGIALDSALGPDTRTDMLAESMTRHAGAAIACTDSGAANAYVLAIKGAYVAPTALVDELKIRCKPGHANTTASTVNAFGLGAKPLVDHAYAPLASGAIDGRDIEMIYRASVGASGSWILPAWANALLVGQTPTSPASITSGEGWSVDGTNHGNLNFGGLSAATPSGSNTFAFWNGTNHKAVSFASLAALFGAGAGSQFVGLSYYTTSGTAGIPAGATKAYVRAWGGGGGGGNNTGGGGGGGGYIEGLITGLTPGGTLSILIGAGGPAGTSGGSTTVDVYMIANGGTGGTPGYGGAAGVGGSTYNNTIAAVFGISGNWGGTSLNVGAQILGGMGGASPFGGGVSQYASGANTGMSGIWPGGGGNGGPSGQVGGAGASGFVSIVWYT